VVLNPWMLTAWQSMATDNSPGRHGPPCWGAVGRKAPDFPKHAKSNDWPRTR